MLLLRKGMKGGSCIYLHESEIRKVIFVQTQKSNLVNSENPSKPFSLSGLPLKVSSHINFMIGRIMYENKVVVEFIILYHICYNTPSARKGGGGNLERGVLVLYVIVSLSPFWLKP